MGTLSRLRVSPNSPLERAWNELLDEVQRRTPHVVPPMTITENAGGFTVGMIRQRGGRGGAASHLEFETVDAGLNTDPTPKFLFNVMPGTIIWHDQIFRVPALPGQKYAAQFAVPQTAGIFNIWLDIGDSFYPSSATIQGNATIWSGSPNQPFPPARRYWDLAKITVTVSGSPAVATATIDMIWRGNITWTSIFGYWY